MRGFRLIVSIACLVATIAPAAPAQGDSTSEEGDAPLMSAETFSGIKLRSIGPALMSGRIGDFAVNPDRPAEYYIAVCSGNVWKTVNNGITFEPIFDDQGSYSIGCITMDPNDSDVIWVGTGENNSQRSVSFGDGVYKSLDAGKSWEHVGLPESEHIGMIAVDPRDSDVVYVAAQGPLWRAGGDRGLYKTTDGGETWEKILEIDEHTGANEVHLDPTDPDVVYCSTYQRRRRVWTLINGGPGSGIWKSTDAGQTWKEVTAGLPTVDMGRIGLDISPADPDVVYAIVEAANDEGGFFRSTDRGETWEKRSDHMTTSPQYYNEITCHPTDVDTVYALDTYLHVTRDGGETFSRVPRENRHVDDHALWINPDDPTHMIIGCDGGIYDTYDEGQNWHFKTNLPVTQFYRVNVDQSEPFYYIYGGTQDNNTQGGPSRTIRREGITNDDWFITVGGDGYETVVDPKDPMILYSQWQYGGLVRHDRRSGEIKDIRPQHRPGEDPHVFNWDTPLILSPHSHTRLYFAGDRLFRSDDRGDSWQIVSPDLTRQLDRNQLEVMGVIQKPDAVSKHRSTSIYGNAVSLDESPIVEGLIYVGTDDGLIHVTEDGGENWRTIASEDVPGVPELTYVSNLTASVHDSDVVYASFDNHKSGDFTPYVYRSDDRGRTWTSIAGDLPERDVCYTLREDHVKPDLLFLGTEFAAYFTVDGGERWIRLSGVPTIAVQDLEVQRRENDLVLGTFGRGFYVLDDYTPLRHVSEEALEQDHILFPVKDAPLYIESSRLGGNNGLGAQGASYYAAPNPPYGAVVTYYLKEKFRTLEEQRHEREKEEDWEYPSIDELRAEDLQLEPSVFLTVRDADGEIVRRVQASREKGFHRVAWDLRYPLTEPINLGEAQIPYWMQTPMGPLAAPGTYTVTLDLHRAGEFETLAGPQEFEVYSLDLATFGADDHNEVLAFRRQAHDLKRAVEGAYEAAQEAKDRIDHLREAVFETPGAGESHAARVEALRLRLEELMVDFRGDPTLADRARPQPPSIRDRIRYVVDGIMYVTSPPTQTQREQYRIAADQFDRALGELRTLVNRDLKNLEAELEDLGAPWTPGRLPKK